MIRRLARFASRKWPQPIYDLRRELGLAKGANPLFDAKHSPYLVLALFSSVLGVEQKDWPEHTLITGFCFYDADAGNAALPPNLEEFMAAGPPPVVFTLGSAAVLAAGDFYEVSARAAVKLGIRAVLLIGADPRNRPSHELPSSICVAEYAPYLSLIHIYRRIEGREKRERRQHVAGPGNPCDLGHQRPGIVQFAQQQQVGACGLGCGVQQVIVGLAQCGKQKVAQPMLGAMLNVCLLYTSRCV